MFSALFAHYRLNHLADCRPAHEQTGHPGVGHRDPPQHVQQPFPPLAGRDHDRKPLHADCRFDIGNKLIRITLNEDYSLAMNLDYRHTSPLSELCTMSHSLSWKPRDRPFNPKGREAC